jgi:hypothetical protein
MTENRALDKATATCRHCGRWIVRLESGCWVDSDGWTACVKGPVLHLPMPDGLKGAP